MSTKVFTGADDFEACHAAVKWLTERGFSVGRMERGEPRGILFGRYNIQKWRNLNARERWQLDATMIGDMRHGPIYVELREGATAQAFEAFFRPDERSCRKHCGLSIALGV